jgi:hypothetical protein
VYLVCGILIILSIILIAVVMFLPAAANIHRINPVFWLETIALFAFGISWLVKGEVVLKDA